MKPFKLQGDFTVSSQEKLDEIANYLLKNLTGLSKNAMALLGYVSAIEKVGRYTPISAEKTAKDLQFKSKAAATTAIKELIDFGVLATTDYRDLFVINENNRMGDYISSSSIKIVATIGIKPTDSTGEGESIQRKRGRKKAASEQNG